MDYNNDLLSVWLFSLKDVRVVEEHSLLALSGPKETTPYFRRLLANVPYQRLNNLSEILSKETEEKAT